MNKKNIRVGVYGVLLIENKLLVIKKSRGPYKNKYDLPGGKIEENESIHDALKREFIEETGYSIEIKDFIASNEVNNHYKNDKMEKRQLYHIGSFYFVKIKSGNLKEFADGEDSNGALFIDINQINKENTSKIAFPIINNYVKKRKN